MGWWKADAPAEASSLSPAVPSSPPQAPPPPVLGSPDTASSCPVDPQTREIWLQQHLEARPPDSAPRAPIQTKILDNLRAPTTTSISNIEAQCSSDTVSQSPTLPSSSISPNTKTRSLSHDRVISSIPRAFPHQPSTPSSPPSNSETETGPHSSGNWIYPSEHQFFTAVLRKHNPQTLAPPPPSSSSSSSSSSTDTLASTVPSIIPIHNAVNERAWSLIQAWERPFSPTSPPQQPRPHPPGPPPCTGPRLLSFRGLGSGPPPSPSPSTPLALLSDYLTLLNPTTPLSPRARWNALRGYQVPFDRHDWVVQRCGGEKVEYVIDFYQGRAPEQQGGRGGGGNLSFYLDVRPKLNSWDGWRTRGLAWGWGFGRWVS